MNNNMTALVSCFSRAYHCRNNENWIFRDEMAEKLLSAEEYNNISSNMSAGISFFKPDFRGTEEEALRFIVDNQLAPSVLGRSAFCEHSLKNAIRLGCTRYVIFGSGYDSFSLRYSSEELSVYELDRPGMLEDKKKRISESRLESRCPVYYVPCDLSEESWMEKLEEAGFGRGEISFGSLLGLSYYLTEEEFEKLLRRISELWCEGSAIVFDYPSCESADGSIRSGEASGANGSSSADGRNCEGGAEGAYNKTRRLAKGAGEEMKAEYSYREIEKLLENCGFLIYEHLNDKEMTETYFEPYNILNPEHRMYAPSGVNYCLAVKK